MENYDKLEKLGQGVYGSVYKVKSKKDDKLYAMKVISNKEYPITEIDILTRFNHPNILHRHDIFYDKKNVYIILELADEDLRSYLLKIRDDENKKRKVIFQFGDSLKCLHEQYYHCDLKLDNILVKDGNILLSDFSLAYSKDIPNNTNVCTTITYRPPESNMNLFLLSTIPKSLQIFFQPQQTLSQFNDMWAYGIICYKIIAGHDLFTEPTDLFEYIKDPLSYFNQYGEIKEEYLSFLWGLLNPVRDERYQSMADVLTDEIFSEIFSEDFGNGDCKKYKEKKSFHLLKNPEIDEIIEYIKDFSIQNKLRVQTCVFALDLFLRKNNVSDKEKTINYGIGCLIISIKLFETQKNNKELKELFEITEIERIKLERIVLENVELLNVKTLYNYAKDLSDLQMIVSNFHKYAENYDEIMKELKKSDKEKSNTNEYTMTFISR
jgi:serine/threonine protein kinase